MPTSPYRQVRTLTRRLSLPRPLSRRRLAFWTRRTGGEEASYVQLCRCRAYHANLASHAHPTSARLYAASVQASVKEAGRVRRRRPRGTIRLRATEHAPRYRGVKSVIALLAALLALFCVVVIEQDTLASALHEVRSNPQQASRATLTVIVAVALVPLGCGLLAYVITALAVPLIRAALYLHRLSRWLGHQLAAAPLHVMGIEPEAMRFDSHGTPQGDTIPVSRALASSVSLLLLGDAGVGKSVSLHAFARHCAGRRQLVGIAFGRAPLPVFISLVSLAEDADLSAAALVSEAVTPFATPGLLAALPSLLKAGRMILLVDELDALPEAARARVAAALATLAGAAHPCRIIAACQLDVYSDDPHSLRQLGHLPRVVLAGLDAASVSVALRRARPPRGEPPAWTRQSSGMLAEHLLSPSAGKPAELSLMIALARHGRDLPAGRAALARAALDLAHGGGSERALNVLGPLACSLLFAGVRALPIPPGQTPGQAATIWLAHHPPGVRDMPAAAMLTADDCEPVLAAALSAGLLHRAPGGGALMFAHSLFAEQHAALWLAATDDGFGWVAPELLRAAWTRPVVLWGALRPDPADVARRLAQLADTPDTTALRAGLGLRAEVPAMLLALAIAVSCEGSAAQLAAANLTERERPVTALVEQRLRDLLDGVQVYLADPTHMPRLAAALRAVSRRAGPEMTAAVAVLTRQPTLSRLLRGQLTTLLGLLATPAALAAVVELLADSDPVMRQATEQALALAGKAALPAIENALDSPDERVRARAGESMARLGSDGEHAALDALRATSATQRLAAARTLGALGAVTAVEALIERLDDPDAGVRREATLALGQLGTPAALQALERRLNTPDPDLRIALASALGASHDTAAFAGLLHLLQDADPQVRTAAVLALGNLGDDVALPAIDGARSDPDPWVRNAAAQASWRLSRG